MGFSAYTVIDPSRAVVPAIQENGSSRCAPSWIARVEGVVRQALDYEVVYQTHQNCQVQRVTWQEAGWLVERRP